MILRHNAEELTSIAQEIGAEVVGLAAVTSKETSTPCENLSDAQLWEKAATETL